MANVVPEVTIEFLQAFADAWNRHGDSDFMPVSHKIKAAGRTLIGVGTRKNTNKHWAKSCHEFRYYENTVEVPVVEESAKHDEGSIAPPLPSDPAADMLKRAVH